MSPHQSPFCLLSTEYQTIQSQVIHKSLGTGSPIVGPYLLGRDPASTQKIPPSRLRGGDSSNRALNTNGSVEALHRGPAALQTSANGHGDWDAGN